MGVTRLASLGTPDRDAGPPAEPLPPEGHVTPPPGLDPFGVPPSDWAPAPAGSTFHDLMRRAGIGPWLQERPHGPTDRDG